MTSEEYAQIVAELNALDYNKQDQRARALEILGQLDDGRDLPQEVAAAAAQAWQRLEAGGGVADKEIFEFRRFRDTAAGVLDQLGMFLGVLDEMNTTAGRRYTEALVTAALSGDPAALRRAAQILDDENAPEAAKKRIAGAFEEIIEQTQGAGVPPQDAGPAATPVEGDETQEAAPPGLSFEDFASQIPTAGDVPFYGVPQHTLDEEGQIVPWAAIVGDEEVAPRYPMGWSKQPGRFGLDNAESIARAQILMEESGMLQPGSYTLGVWDPVTAGRGPTEGWQRVLAFANVTGTDWEAAFERLYDAGVDAASRGMQLELDRLARAPMFEDPERLRNRARRFLISMGRANSQITDEELESIMQAAVMGAQQSRMAQLTEGIERQAQLGMRGEQAVAALGSGGMPVAPLQQPEMDPIAHFDSALLNVMGREIESREAQEEAAGGAQRMTRTAGMIGSARE